MQSRQKNIPVERDQYSTILHNWSFYHPLSCWSSLLQLPSGCRKLWFWAAQIPYILWHIFDTRTEVITSIVRSTTLFCVMGHSGSRTSKQLHRSRCALRTSINCHNLKIFIQCSSLAHSTGLARTIIQIRSQTSQLVSPRLAKYFWQTFTSSSTTNNNSYATSP
jgi:hypothetical protein